MRGSGARGARRNRGAGYGSSPASGAANSTESPAGSSNGVTAIRKNRTAGNEFVFLNAWNEWGEGNYMEPDLKYGHGFLEVLKKNL